MHANCKIVEMLFFCVTFSSAYGTLVVKVNCPDDEKMRAMITKKAPGENFEVQCSKPIPKHEPGKCMNKEKLLTLPQKAALAN